MNQANRAGPRSTLPLVRCAIYTRKSTEEGLEQEFNSLDAQRESAEAFIKSQAGEGWTALPGQRVRTAVRPWYRCDGNCVVSSLEESSANGNNAGCVRT